VFSPRRGADDSSLQRHKQKLLLFTILSQILLDTLRCRQTNRMRVWSSSSRNPFNFLSSCPVIVQNITLIQFHYFLLNLFPPINIIKKTGQARKKNNKKNKNMTDRERLTEAAQFSEVTATFQCINIKSDMKIMI
jgi:hypothetical protein